MTTPHAEQAANVLPHEPEKATLEGRNKVLGFWLFLGGEAVLFGTLFATFLTLRNQVADGPSASELFSLPITAAATFILLVGSLTSVFAVQALHRGNRSSLAKWLGITVLLGLAFLVLEIYEFTEYMHEGYSMTTSAFSSAFYSSRIPRRARLVRDFMDFSHHRSVVQEGIDRGNCSEGLCVGDVLALYRRRVGIYLHRSIPAWKGGRLA